MKELDPVRIEISEKHLRAATDRVIAKIAPNGPKNQQFKDSLAWEAAIELANTYAVMLVSPDNHFREKGHPELAKQLSEQASRTRGNIKIYETLSECLEALKVKSKPVDAEVVEPILDKSVRSAVTQNAHQSNFALGELTERDIKFYALDTLDRLSLVFLLRYSVNDLQDESTSRREQAVATITGSCFYHEEERSVSGLKIDEIFFDWTNSDGTRGHSGYVLASMLQESRTTRVLL